MALYFGGSKQKIVSQNAAFSLRLFTPLSTPTDRTVIMEEQTLTFTESGDIYVYQTDTPMVDSIVNGMEYVVVWDGVEYKCTAKQDGSIFLGNVFLITGTAELNTGEPFGFILTSDMTAIGTDDTTTDTHTVAIYQEPSSRTVIFEETTLPFTEDGGLWIYTFNEDVFGFVPDEEYVVVWDGVEYEFTAKAFTPEDAIATATVGNQSIIGMGDDSGESFLMITMPPMMSGSSWMSAIFTSDSSENHTVTVYHKPNGRIVFMEEKPLSFVYSKGLGCCECDPIPQTYFVGDSKQYTVVFDGVTYECMSYIYGNYIIIGNASKIYPDLAESSEPFTIIYDGNNLGGGMIAEGDSDITHTVAIYR